MTLLVQKVWRYKVEGWSYLGKCELPTASQSCCHVVLVLLALMKAYSFHIAPKDQTTNDCEHETGMSKVTQFTFLPYLGSTQLVVAYFV